MATKNPHKKERFAHYLEQLGLSVISFADIENEVEVIEDGKTPEENALKKAIAGFNAVGIPAFGVDYWFYMEGVPDEIQPGPFVRRIFNKSCTKVEATDEEMLTYYTGLVDRLGGKTKGLWVSAIALVIDNSAQFTERFERETLLTSKPSLKRTEGEPLNSIQIDPSTGKYFTDLSRDEWLKLQEEREMGYIDFFKNHLDLLK